MSVALKIMLNGDLNGEYEITVDKGATVEDIIAAISSREGCNNRHLTIRKDGKVLRRNFSLKDMDDMGSIPALNATLQEPKARGSVTIADKKPPLSNVANMQFGNTSGRFSVGYWVETKIKDSLLASDNSDEWCLGQVLRDTGSGYEIEIFESYKYFMPPRVKAADNEVRAANRQSLRIARTKSGEYKFDGEEGKSDSKSDDAAFPKILGEAPLNKPKRGRARSYEIRVKRRSRSREIRGRGVNHSRKRSNSRPRSTSKSRSTPKPRSTSKPRSNLKSKRSRTRSDVQVSKSRRSRSAQIHARSKQTATQLSTEYRAKVQEYIKKFPDIEPRDIKVYIRLFRTELDKKRKGVITRSELSKWIRRNNIEVKEASLDEMMKLFEIDSDAVNMENFIDLICCTKSGLKNRELRELFKTFDTDLSGIITVEELRSGLKKLFEQDIPDAKLNKMIEEADSTGTGTICFCDFKKMMSN